MSKKRKPRTKHKSIPVLDLFAGPGGLGEGFAAHRGGKSGSARFNIQLSIEKDANAVKTLRLRSFFRQFADDQIPEEYYSLLRDVKRPINERLEELYSHFPRQAACAVTEAMHAELGNTETSEIVDDAIANAVGGQKHWVLLGGPPCQAYSLVGRSRNRGNAEYVPSKDGRQFLYREYLRVIAMHQPSVFVMENVKGLLSATVKNQQIFQQIIDDLQSPCLSAGISPQNGSGSETGYQLFSLGSNDSFGGTNLNDFVVRMEEHGVPQARHRLIIVGVRDDLGLQQLPKTLGARPRVSVKSIIDDLPRLRAGLSKEADSEDAWSHRLQELLSADWFLELGTQDAPLKKKLDSIVHRLKKPREQRGDEWVRLTKKRPSMNEHMRNWLLDQSLTGVFNHSTRGHIAQDLHRYLFCACYAEQHGKSPSLKDFPAQLLPKHANVDKALAGSLFADRFRVQLAGSPSTTITSHISKDGHYYIHHDPTQCRSLTVREASRLQTFPDNYFFCGPRTSQYTQVGNAVPPYFATQVAEIVEAILQKSGVL
ncbi:DNA (cytosine-5-)-methyltransferase [Rhodopirellula sp.]|nr:DNA (cytosine-5-)-methyltransferase [Rhodopirellula sp.]